MGEDSDATEKKRPRISKGFRKALLTCCFPSVYLAIFVGALLIYAAVKMDEAGAAMQTKLDNGLGDFDSFMADTINQTNQFIRDVPNTLINVTNNLIIEADVALNNMVATTNSLIRVGYLDSSRALVVNINGLLIEISSLLNRPVGSVPSPPVQFVTAPVWDKTQFPPLVFKDLIPQLPFNARAQGGEASATVFKVYHQFTLATLIIGIIVITISALRPIVKFFWVAFAWQKIKPERKITKACFSFTNLGKGHIGIPIAIMLFLGLSSLALSIKISQASDESRPPILKADSDIRDFVAKYDAFINAVAVDITAHLNDARVTVNSRVSLAINQSVDLANGALNTVRSTVQTQVNAVTSQFNAIVNFPAASIPRIDWIPFPSPFPLFDVSFLIIDPKFFQLQDILFPVLDKSFAAMNSMATFLWYFGIVIGGLPALLIIILFFEPFSPLIVEIPKKLYKKYLAPEKDKEKKRKSGRRTPQTSRDKIPGRTPKASRDQIPIDVEAQKIVRSQNATTSKEKIPVGPIELPDPNDVPPSLPPRPVRKKTASKSKYPKPKGSSKGKIPKGPVPMPGEDGNLLNPTVSQQSNYSGLSISVNSNQGKRALPPRPPPQVPSVTVSLKNSPEKPEKPESTSLQDPNA